MRYLPLLIGIFLLSACSVQQPPTKTLPVEESTKSSEPLPSPSTSLGTGSAPSEVKEGAEERETHNVSYRGLVQPAGISIYMQGSHRLMLSDGRFILLESEEIDLNEYVGEEVELSGSTRATIEAKGIIMRVEKVKLVVSASSESTTDESPPSQSPEPVIEEQPKKPNELNQPNEPPSEASAAVIEAMAQEKFTADQWTQEYCSSHIGFCIPVHRNWWYKSFGTTTTTLWHIEVGNSPVLNLGDGPISINLFPGDLSFETQTISDVRIHDDMIVASRPWSGNRHFEIRAHAQLEAAVRYMIEHISAYEGN